MNDPDYIDGKYEDARRPNRAGHSVRLVGDSYYPGPNERKPTSIWTVLFIVAAIPTIFIGLWVMSGGL